MLMYADDTTLYCNFNKNIHEMIINRELYKVSTWLSANKLPLNVSKTKFIMFRTLNKGMHYSMLKLNDTVIERVDKFKFLGIWLDEYLNWGPHIDHVCLKISRMNGTLNRLKHHCQPTVLMILYNTLILPHINYGILLWGAKVNKDHEMHLLQKKSVRLITNKHYNAHSEPIFKDLILFFHRASKYYLVLLVLLSYTFSVTLELLL